MKMPENKKTLNSCANQDFKVLLVMMEPLSGFEPETPTLPR